MVPYIPPVVVIDLCCRACMNAVKYCACCKEHGMPAKYCVERHNPFPYVNRAYPRRFIEHIAAVPA